SISRPRGSASAVPTPRRLPPLLPRRPGTRLLVEVDGSPSSHGALVGALREAARREGLVVAVSVLDDEPATPLGSPVPPARAEPPPDPRAPAAGPEALTLPAAVLAAAARGHLETTLREVVQAAVDHVGAGFGALGVLTADSLRLDRLVVVGMDDGEAQRISR